MPSAKVTLNSVGVESILTAPGVRADLMRRMAPVLAAAQANAPVATGAYRDSLHIEVDETDRVVVRVVSDVSYALGVEAKTGNLSRALDQAGGA